MSEHEDHSAAKRQQIVSGAELVFTECGYEGASMSRIAAQAGVSKGTLYNYFDGKSTLFAWFVEDKARRNLDSIFQTVAEEDDPAAALGAIALRMLEMTLSPNNLALYRMVVAEAQTFPELATVFWNSGPCRAIAYMTDWVGRQVAAGRLATDNASFAAEQFLALCQTRVAMQCRLQLIAKASDAEIEQVVSGAVRVFLAAYGVDPLASRGSSR